MSAFRLRWAAETDDGAIERAAASLTAGSETLHPINPASIADRFGARVVRRPLDTFPGGGDRHGELHVVGRRWEISVPSDISATRQRFSIAHEIGHILLFDVVAEQPALVRELRTPAVHDYVEGLCDKAAARILMPAAAFSRSIDEFGGRANHELIDRLMERFWVSAEAAVRRIVELDPAATLIIWDRVLDHPRGPAWRTSKHQDREYSQYIPDGLSASRLRPDVVSEAAESGAAYSASATLDAPRFDRLTNLLAFRRPERARNNLPVEEFESVDTTQQKRIYLIADARKRSS
jgi:hypothetical protein